MRGDVGAIFPIAGVARQTLVSAPEPGTLLLLGMGVLALVIRGVRQMRS